VVVGGGVIGLSIAWHLAREGASVTVLERGRVGGQASGAAAGMTAPLAEAPAASPLLDLGLSSLRLYPAFTATLREETGLDPEFVGPGMLRVALDDEEAAALQEKFAWQRSAGLPLALLEPGDVRRLEPALTPTVATAIVSVEEKHVEPRRLVRALAQAGARRGVRVIENESVTGFETRRERILYVETSVHRHPCAQVVIAGGAWSQGLGHRLGVDLPVFPVRGQILALSCLPPPVRHSIYARPGYLVPKADGRLVVGATQERAGFEAHPTAGGVLQLLETARALVPALATAPFDGAWAGLRPGTVDGLPILGRLPGRENAWAAAGHFRNGVLLAPITGEILAREMAQGRVHPLAEPCRPERFGARAVAEGARAPAHQRA